MLFNTLNIQDIKLQLGKFVKTMRKQEGLSQAELADLLSLSRITVQNLESGKNFTIDTLLKALQHFDQLSELNNLLSKQIVHSKKIDSLY